LNNPSANGIDYLGMIVGYVAVWNDPMDAIPNQQRSLKCILVMKLYRWIVQCL